MTLKGYHQVPMSLLVFVEVPAIHSRYLNDVIAALDN